VTSSYSGATPAGGQTTATPPGPTTATNYAAGPETTAHSGNLGTPTTPTGQPDVEHTSVGQLIGEVTKDLSTLMRQELELAKAEMKVEAKKAGQGAGMFGAAGLAGYMTALFLSIALWWALAHLVGHSWSALIVALLWGAVAAVTAVMGKKKFQQVNSKPERTVDTLQQVPGALKPH
jgi:F0F1-type ATP synthase assembly protein I